MRHPQLQIILKQIQAHFSSLYREQLDSLILYGSQAREDSRIDSDIDLLVVLHAPVNPFQEIDRTGEFIAQLCLKYDVLISRHFISSEKFKSVNNPFLCNVKNDGVSRSGK